jgi:hypothetical protein
MSCESKVQQCELQYLEGLPYDADSDVTLNPWQNNRIGADTYLFDSWNKENITLSSPLLYARIVQRKISLQRVNLSGKTEAEYLTNKGLLDKLYEEGDKKLITGTFRIYGAFEVPTWAQELGKFGMTETDEVTMNFNISSLTGILYGSVLHIGDLLQVYDNLHGWKWYEIMNALPYGQNLGQYLMWQIVGKRTDLEGYIELEKRKDLNDPRDAETKAPTENVNPRPRPKIY